MIPPRWRFPAGLALLLASLAAGIYLATEHLARPWTVNGSSMEPALRHGDRVIVDLWSYRRRPPRPGEVVLVRGPSPRSPSLIKRVARPPGGLANGAGTAGEPLAEARAGDSVWVLGDNAERSEDSRHFGPLSADRVQGRVCLRYWPPSRAGRIR